jgi:hypothetical protein
MTLESAVRREGTGVDARQAVIEVGLIQERILLIRDDKVMIDADLAEFYGASTKRLNEQVRRNRRRFPDDFVFRLTAKEKSEVVAKCDHLTNLKYSRSLPLAFTEHGALMAASVLNTPRAVEMSVFIVRAFVSLREAVLGYKELSNKLGELERRLGDHDGQLSALVTAIRQLMSPEAIPRRRRIGFDRDE